MKHLKSSDAQLLRRTVTSCLSDDEHQLFVLACERSGLDPFARQIYFMRDRGKLVIEATIDGLRFSAERTGKYSGQLGPEWCGPDGVWKTVWTGQQPPHAARVGIRRSDFTDPVYGVALYAEYTQGSDFWERMASNQLAKCAEALAFRKAFPREFSGLYTPEEMAQAISGSAAVRESQPLDSEHGDHPRPSPVPVPLPLQPFVEAGLQDRRNVQAAFGFLQVELTHALGAEGTAAFRRIYAKHMGHGLFRTKEACAKATLDSWLELWAAVEGAQQGREAAA